MDSTKSGKDVENLTDLIQAYEARKIKLEERGEWYTTTAAKGTEHFFMCANPKVDTAVSMCGMQVAKIEDLHTPGEGKVCLTCSLYEQGGKGLIYQAKLEQRRRHAARVQEIVDQREERKRQEKERRTKGRKNITRRK
jgi:hypothetical protein